MSLNSLTPQRYSFYVIIPIHKRLNPKNPQKLNMILGFPILFKLSIWLQPVYPSSNYNQPGKITCLFQKKKKSYLNRVLFFEVSWNLKVKAEVQNNPNDPQKAKQEDLRGAVQKKLHSLRTCPLRLLAPPPPRLKDVFGRLPLRERIKKVDTNCLKFSICIQNSLKRKTRKQTCNK